MNHLLKNKSSNKLFAKLEKISADNISGSNQLLFELNKLFLKEFDSVDLSLPLIEELKIKFSSFGSIRSYLNDLANLIRARNLPKLEKYLASFNSKINNQYQSIFNNLSPYLTDEVNIVTISNSSTVYEILLRIQKINKLLNVFVCESRPNFEGRVLAELLSAHKMKVELILEANIPYYVEKSDLCLVGADKILINDNVINKIGSKILALCCKYYEKPFFVLADKSKKTNEIEHHEISKTSKEIWNKKPDQIKISNYYFEQIQNNLISKIISDIE